MDRNYWSNIANRRLTRRRAIATSGGIGLGAALLAACGGSNNTKTSTGSSAASGSTAAGGSSGASGASGSSGAQSSLVAKSVDTTAQAKAGGSLKDYAQAEPRSLDPVQPLADYNRIAPFVYNTLLSSKAGHLTSPTGELAPALAQSWEIAPDGLTVTLKLRQGVKWHNIAPVSGRAFSTDDVLFSFDRYQKMGPLASQVFNSVSPGAPVTTVTAPDASTIVMKLKEPNVYLPNWFASFGSFTGQIIMFPKEAADTNTLNLGKDIIGTGPFQLKSHTPSVGFTLVKNPDFWDKNANLIDTIEMPIVPEYATRLSELKSGNVYYGISANTLRAEDVLSLKKDEPRILLYQSPFDTTTPGVAFTFGHLPAGGSKFQDERVRQAVSMSWDRDLYIQTFYNTDKFAQAGLPQSTAWCSGLLYIDSYNAGGWFLDPQGKDFGDNAKYYQHDVAEAKKLLSAAGFPSGFDTELRYPATAQYNLEQQTQPIIGFLQDIGINAKPNAINDYTQEYIPHDRDASGEYEGLGIHSVTGGTPTLIHAISALCALHLPTSGVTFNGYDITGKGDKSGDPQLIDMLTRARTSQDPATQKSLMLDAQRLLGKSQYSMMLPGTATGFWAAWPAVQNFQTWQGGVDEVWEHYAMWIDPTKAPLA
ncbi:MAG TPA: ABC transporter substrate-binding protein [Dehalococcoidia bacterium]|nr:ABC transporter substrate-binding protein [Dehalococcoidia bacterium]